MEWLERSLNYLMTLDAYYAHKPMCEFLGFDEHELLHIAKRKMMGYTKVQSIYRLTEAKNSRPRC